MLYDLIGLSGAKLIFIVFGSSSSSSIVQFPSTFFLVSSGPIPYCINVPFFSISNAILPLDRGKLKVLGRYVWLSLVSSS
jgi:hypothetical protein